MHNLHGVTRLRRLTLISVGLGGRRFGERNETDANGCRCGHRHYARVSATSGAAYGKGVKNNIPGTILSLYTGTKIETTLYDFPPAADGYGRGGGDGLPVVNGALYGVTYALGANNAGSILQLVT